MHCYCAFTLKAWGWGDPHITTTDGRRYTFNGLGEYVLLRTSLSDFEFQGRTARASDSHATIFSAFALSENNDKIEVMYVRMCNSTLNELNVSRFILLMKVDHFLLYLMELMCQTV